MVWDFVFVRYIYIYTTAHVGFNVASPLHTLNFSGLACNSNNQQQPQQQLNEQLHMLQQQKSYVQHPMSPKLVSLENPDLSSRMHGKHRLF